MAFNFKAAAQAATSLSDLMSNREKRSTDEMISKYPDGFTITDFDMIGTGDDEYTVFVIKEDPGIFFYGGTILKKMVNAWLAGFDDIETCREEFKKDGGLPIRMTTGKTKDGRMVTKIDVL